SQHRNLMSDVAGALDRNRVARVVDKAIVVGSERELRCPDRDRRCQADIEYVLRAGSDLNGVEGVIKEDVRDLPDWRAVCIELTVDSVRDPLGDYKVEGGCRDRPNVVGARAIGAPYRNLAHLDPPSSTFQAAGAWGR